MNKRHLHHLLTRLKKLHTSYFVILLVVAGLMFVFGYRQNNLTALELRDKLLEVDKQNGDVEAALTELRSFTYSHMNANLSAGSNNIYPPIQLKYRYERLVEAEKNRVAALNADLYTQAQNYCEQQVTSRVTINRVPCIQEYLTTNGAATQRAIPDAMYKFDFVAPIWSPDLAGWSFVVFVLTAVALVIRLASEWLLRALLHR